MAPNPTSNGHLNTGGFRPDPPLPVGGRNCGCKLRIAFIINYA
jgi:hypothetical protein